MQHTTEHWASELPGARICGVWETPTAADDLAMTSTATVITHLVLAQPGVQMAEQRPDPAHRGLD
jgi:hypothetical protein